MKRSAATSNESKRSAVMSSGTLPFANYHRASSLGSGSFGSVVTVYNDDGEEFAFKTFLNDDDEENDDSVDSDDRSYQKPKKLNLGAMREISILRLLRGDNAHPNIVQLVDVHSDVSEEAAAAGIDGSLSVALPLYKRGSLLDALERNQLGTLCPRRVKVALAHGILSAVAYLHDNDIFHRDIKSDNIMLEPEEQGDGWRPILIDFSIAKLVQSQENIAGEPVQHTGDMGTVAYTAPEIVARDEYYGKPVDLYSVGVVLLELLTGQPLSANRDRHASEIVRTTLEGLPVDQPFPDLLRGLLHRCPDKRLTARQALAHPLFAKFGLKVPPVRILNLSEALPLEVEEEDVSPKSTAGRFPNKSRTFEKRQEIIRKVCVELDCENPMTYKAAFEYCRVLSQLDDTIDDLTQSQSLIHCCVLAARFFEVYVRNLSELDEMEQGIFQNWRLSDYVDEETTIFMIMDYCLYPRHFI